MQKPVSRGHGCNLPIEFDIFDVNTDREMGNTSDAAFGIDAPIPGFIAHDAHARAEEVASIRMCLEADEIAAEHAVEKGLPTRQIAEVF